MNMIRRDNLRRWAFATAAALGQADALTGRDGFFKDLNSITQDQADVARDLTSMVFAQLAQDHDDEALEISADYQELLAREYLAAYLVAQSAMRFLRVDLNALVKSLK